MVNIKLCLYEILSGAESFINKVLKANIDIFNTNYTELYMYPKNEDLYIKVKKGKKHYYKKVKYFFNTNPINDSLDIYLEDNKYNDPMLNVVFDFELAIEEDHNNE